MKKELNLIVLEALKQEMFHVDTEMCYNLVQSESR